MQTRSKNSFSLRGFGSRRTQGFSLVEVVIAVGIFALAVVAIVGIMAAVGKSVTDVQEAEKASRLVTVVQARLQAASFATITANLKTEAELQADDANASYDPSGDAKIFFASEDGSIVAPYAPASGWSLDGTLTTATDQDALKFFELALVRNTTLSPSGNDGTAGFIAFNIRVRWPAFLGNGTRVSDNLQKSVLLVPAAVTR